MDALSQKKCPLVVIGHTWFVLLSNEKCPTIFEQFKFTVRPCVFFKYKLYVTMEMYEKKNRKRVKDGFT
jgi:hypothetical protein